MKVGDLVKYTEKIHEVAEIKSDHRGLWIKLSSSPLSNNATPCEGIHLECWFLSTSLERINEGR